MSEAKLLSGSFSEDWGQVHEQARGEASSGLFMLRAEDALPWHTWKSTVLSRGCLSQWREEDEVIVSLEPKLFGF